MRNDVGMCTFKSHVICYTIQDLQSNKTKSVIFQTNCRCLHTGGWFLKYYINLASKHEINVEPKATAALCFPSNNLYFMQACQDVFLQKAYNGYYCIWLQQLNFSWQKTKKTKQLKICWGRFLVKTSEVLSDWEPCLTSTTCPNTTIYHCNH